MDFVQSLIARLLPIRSEDETIRRNGRLLFYAACTLYISIFLDAIRFLNNPNAFDVVMVSPYIRMVVAILLLAWVRWWLVQARIVAATNVILLSFNLLILIWTANLGVPNTYPYLMILTIVAISFLGSILMGFLYSGGILFVVFLVGAISENFIQNTYYVFAFSVLGVAGTTWLFANDLRRTATRATKLTDTLQKNTRMLQANNDLIEQRASRLQLIADISKATSSANSLSEVLVGTVYPIRDQFGFYHVSLFLKDEVSNQLILREATGEIGQRLKAQNYAIPISEDSMIGWVAVHEQPRIVRDVTKDPIYLLERELDKTRSELTLPLLAQGELLGVLDVQSRRIDVFQQEDISILQILANQIAINIKNTRLYEETQSRLNQTRVLVNFNQLLTTTLDVNEIYRRSARAIAEKLQAVVCTIHTWEATLNTLTTQAIFSFGVSEDAVNSFEVVGAKKNLLDFSATKQTLKQAEPMIYAQGNEELGEMLQQFMKQAGLTAVIETPLVKAGKAIGLIRTFRPASQASFEEADKELSIAIANQVTIALENARLATESRARVAQLSMLNRLSNALSLANTLKDVFDGARAEILSLIEATAMSVFLLDENKIYLDWVYAFEYGQEIDVSEVRLLSIDQGFSGYIARTKEILLLSGPPEVQQKSAELGAPMVGETPDAWLGLPLVVKNELIGVIAIENGLDEHAFQEREVEIMRTISGPMAIAINNLLQFEAVQRALQAQSEQKLQLQTAAEVAAAATSVLDQTVLIQRAVELIQERFSLYYVGLFLINPQTNYAILQAGTGEAGRMQLEKNHQLTVGGRSLIGGATGDGEARITQDVYSDPEWRPNPALPNTRSELALPLQVRGNIIGALTIQSTEPHTFTSELLSTLQTMCDQLAVSIDNTRLLEQSQERAERQQKLNEISGRLYRSSDVEEIVRISLEALSENLSGAKIALTLGRPEKKNGKS